MMFWWFVRGGAYMRCEALQLATRKYELRVIEPDGTESVEAFDEAADLAERQQQMLAGFSASGWSGPHGWVL
jgi:hypothetical protein